MNAAKDFSIRMCYSASSLRENFGGADGFLILLTKKTPRTPEHMNSDLNCECKSTNAPLNDTKRQEEKRLECKAQHKEIWSRERLPSLLFHMALHIMSRHSLEESLPFLCFCLFLRQVVGNMSYAPHFWNRGFFT